jgi:hypothetical protein
MQEIIVLMKKEKFNREELNFVLSTLLEKISLTKDFLKAFSSAESETAKSIAKGVTGILNLDVLVHEMESRFSARSQNPQEASEVRLFIPTTRVCEAVEAQEREAARAAVGQK